MKRTFTAVLLVLALQLAATAQNRGFAPGSSNSPSVSSSTATSEHGTPSSSSSQTPARTFVPARPRTKPFGSNGFAPQCATVGPLIPSAMGCTDPRFTGGTVHLHPRFSDTFPIYVPYPVAVEAQPAPQEVQEPDPPGLTVFERRAIAAPVRPATAGTPDSRAGADAADQRESATPAEPQVPTVLIFRDGHRAEVLNYAIVGQTLYDLGPFVAHKIPLSNLNLKATIKANEERGVDFALPASTKLD